MKIKKSYIIVLLLFFLSNNFTSFYRVHPKEDKEKSHKGRILFDESHSEFWTSKIDGGFSSITRELISEGFTIDVLKKGPISKKMLLEYDVLVIASPFIPPKLFTNEELLDIEAFVRSGGGLLVIGIGWSWVDYSKMTIIESPVNQLGKIFGIMVNDDIIFDESNNTGKNTMPLFTKFAIHPITVGINKIAPIGYPSSLNLSDGVKPIILGDDDAYSGYHCAIYNRGSNPPVAAVREFDLGRVVFIGTEGFFADLEPEGLYNLDNLRFAKNVFNWLAETPFIQYSILVEVYGLPSEYSTQLWVNNMPKKQISGEITERITLKTIEPPIISVQPEIIVSEGIRYYIPTTSKTISKNGTIFFEYRLQYKVDVIYDPDLWASSSTWCFADTIQIETILESEVKRNWFTYHFRCWNYDNKTSEKYEISIWVDKPLIFIARYEVMKPSFDKFIVALLFIIFCFIFYIKGKSRFNLSDNFPLTFIAINITIFGALIPPTTFPLYLVVAIPFIFILFLLGWYHYYRTPK